MLMRSIFLVVLGLWVLGCSGGFSSHAGDSSDGGAVSAAGGGAAGITGAGGGVAGGATGAAGAGGAPFDWQSVWVHCAYVSSSTPAAECDALCAPRAGSCMNTGWCTCGALSNEPDAAPPCDPCNPARADAGFVACPEGMHCRNVNQCWPAGYSATVGAPCQSSFFYGAPTDHCAPGLQCPAGICERPAGCP
jgi:hypothetical protein